MKMLLAAWLATLSLAAPALAQPQTQAPPQPQMPTGHSDRPPMQAVVGEGPGQILLLNIVGQPLYAPAHNRLGTVTDALIDPKRGTVDVVILDTIRGSAPRVISWNALDMNNRKHVSADLTPAQLQSTSPDVKNGKALDQRAGNTPGLVSAKKRLLGNPIVGREGKTLGTLRDIVVDEKTGGLVAAVLDINRGINFDSPPHRVVPWSVVAPAPRDGKPVTIRLTRAEIEQEPSMATMAPVAPQKVGPGVGSSSGPLGNRGHKVPVPPRSPSTQRTD